MPNPLAPLVNALKKINEDATRPLANLTLDEIVAKLPTTPLEAFAFYTEHVESYKEASRELLFRARGITKDNPHGDKLNPKVMRQLAGDDFYIIGFSVEGANTENYLGLRHRGSGFIASYPLCY